MPTRLLSILVIVAVMSGCGASAEQIEAARLRIRVLASCLDEVAEGIGTGAFEPKYAECIDILGRNDGQGFRELQAADMRVAVMDLLSERETAFQTQIDRATEAQDTDARRSAMVAYQIMLGATADELRTLIVATSGGIGQKSRSNGRGNYRRRSWERSKSSKSGLTKSSRTGGLYRGAWKLESTLYRHRLSVFPTIRMSLQEAAGNRRRHRTLWT